MIEFTDTNTKGANIKVIGVGGGGGNAINTMIKAGLDGCTFIAANTDLQALKSSPALIKIQLGCELTKGLGAGANPEVGKNAALEDQDAIKEVIQGADMLFITAGMGGGTGTGATPIIAELAKELGILVVAVVTKPFEFEGRRRMRQAEEGVNTLRQNVDSLLIIPNQRLLSIAGDNMTLLETFKCADNVLLQGVRGITDLITIPGLINLDFADVRTVMGETGQSLMGIGAAAGEGRAIEAAKKAIFSPLLEDISIKGARGILINITGGPNLTLREVNDASTIIQQEAHEDANIIFGSVINESMKDDVIITVIATGFDRGAKAAAAVASAAKEQKKTVIMTLPRPFRTQREEHRGDFELPVKKVKDVFFDPKKLGAELGLSNFDDSSYDIPTFIRKQAD